MTQPDDDVHDDVPRPLLLGERLTVVGELLRRRHLPVYAWAAGFAPVLARVESLSQSWERRFERDESGEPRAMTPRPPRSIRFPADPALTGRPQPADATAEPAAAVRRPESPERILPVDLRARLRNVAGPGADQFRVRADAAADATARSQRADAVTIGADVHLRAGRFRPDTPAGFALLAHEASHVTALLAPGGAGRRTSPAGVTAEERTAGQVEWLARRDPLGAGHNDHTSTPPYGAGSRAGRLASRPPEVSTLRPLPVAAATSSAAATPMRAEVDRADDTAPEPVDLEALRQGLIDDVMHRLRTDFERGG
ncbi:DUF4157 domain-containing protein [Kribbella sp. NBC_01510]|uniref:eCIS core domain-containing protein n=1 Tax=Kribbella sp. NBC_01510 TaxID=2903581 RepID=UPI00386592D3